MSRFVSLAAATTAIRFAPKRREVENAPLPAPTSVWASRIMSSLGPSVRRPVVTMWAPTRDDQGLPGPAASTAGPGRQFDYGDFVATWTSRPPETPASVGSP